MAFYIKPPSGNCRYEQLSLYGRKRLEFLRQVSECEDTSAFQSLLQQEDTVVNSECLIEGAKKDRISHFFLRLACANDREMASFLIKSETQLFCLRFTNMSSAELVSLLKSTYRFVHHLIRRNHQRNTNKNFILKSAEDLYFVLKSALGNGRTWKSLIEQYMNNDLNDTICVPFEYALSLVKHREVILKRGIAFVPCTKLHQILASLFEQIVVDGLKRAKYIYRQVCEDERMVNLFKELRHIYYAGCRIGSTIQWDLDPIICTDVEYLEQNFPPCMQNLHKSLRQKHRLRHFSRIQYTLFLKEIGMPVHEAIRFWRREYSQHANNHNHSAGCDHSWSKDSKRYTYNIRHLYGLEGCRTNYSAHSCYAMQNCSLGHGEDGGCIFTHFDDRNLKEHLTSASIPLNSQSVILDFVQNKHYQSACEEYFQGRLKQRQRKRHCTDDGGVCKISTSSNLEHDDESSKEAMKINLQSSGTKIRHVQETKRDEVVMYPNHEEDGSTDRDIGVNIEKPSDYFFSYKQLLRALQSMK